MDDYREMIGKFKNIKDIVNSGKMSLEELFQVSGITRRADQEYYKRWL